MYPKAGINNYMFHSIKMKINCKNDIFLWIWTYMQQINEYDDNKIVQNNNNNNIG